MMINVETYSEMVRTFIRESAASFRQEFPDEKVVTLGLFGEPHNGYLSMNFETRRHRTLCCGDFNYFEYRILSIDEWQNEYEAEFPVVRISDKQIFRIDWESGEFGDEEFDGFFYPMMVQAMKDFKGYPEFAGLLKDDDVFKVGVEIGDSKHKKFWRPDVA